ncbi:MAG: hypothetical protein EB141_10795 [Verrucomicrobia bacterium]|nr:hypothetical protein [Verrucomicrobiota bacterium]NDB76115.1 hypothetical protein [Verrucomicrobiota bacterium]
MGDGQGLDGTVFRWKTNRVLAFQAQLLSETALPHPVPLPLEEGMAAVASGLAKPSSSPRDEWLKRTVSVSQSHSDSLCFSLSLGGAKAEGRGEGLLATALAAAPLIRPAATFSPRSAKGEGSESMPSWDRTPVPALSGSPACSIA